MGFAGHSNFRVPWFKRLRIDLDLVIFIFALLGLNASYFPGNFLPVHDTRAVLDNFHFFYSEYFFHGEFAHWQAYGSYGFPAESFQVGGLTPTCYLVGWLGSLCRCPDVVLLFKLSVFLDQAIFAWGLLRLSRLLFKDRAVWWMVVLGGIGSCVWYRQIWFNFRIYYLLPFILEALVLFFTTQQPKYLWKAGLISTLSMVGGIAYVGPLLLLMLPVFSFPFLWKNPGIWRRLGSPSKEHLAWLLLALLSAALLLAALIHLQWGIVSYIPGRDAHTYSVSLLDFLTHNRPMVDVAAAFVTGWPCDSDITYYVGLLPLFFFFWALVRVRSTMYGAFLLLTLALLWLSLGGLFSTLIYYVPTLSWFRHLGHLYPILRILILVCAGFGLQDFFKVVAAAPISAFRFPLRYGLAGLCGALFLLDVFDRSKIQHFVTQLGQEAEYPLSLLRILAYGCGLTGLVLEARIASRGNPSREANDRMRRSIPVVLLLCFASDLVLFQLDVQVHKPHLSHQLNEELAAYQASCTTYQERQKLSEATGRQAQALALATRPNGGNFYQHSFCFIQVDPCLPEHLLLMFLSGVDRLFRARGAIPQYHAWGGDFLAHASDPVLLHMLACHTHKALVTAQVAAVESVEDAVERIREKTKPGGPVILSGVPAAEVRPGEGPNSADPEAGAAHVSHFSANRVLFEVDAGPRADLWLVYADAWHPGWRAYVNGREVRIAQANLAFKAVQLEAGRNRVEFRFACTTGWALALYGFCAGWILVAALVRALLWQPAEKDQATVLP